MQEVLKIFLLYENIGDPLMDHSGALFIVTFVLGSMIIFVYIMIIFVRSLIEKNTNFSYVSEKYYLMRT